MMISVSTVSMSRAGSMLRIDVGHVMTLEASDHMGNSIHLPDLSQVLVAQSLALVGILDETGDVDEFYGSG